MRIPAKLVPRTPTPRTPDLHKHHPTPHHLWKSGQVGFDGVALVVEDRASPKVTLGHPERLLDLPELVVGADHVLGGRVGQVGDVGLPAGQGAGLGLQFAVD